MTTKYFKNIRDIETLKEQYRAVAKKYHSDINHGGDEAMKQINAEYARLKSIYANIHRTGKTEQAEPKHATSKQAEPKHATSKQAEPQNAPDSLKFIAIRLSALDGIKLEICGKWLWISGNTAKHRDTLKDNGCRWAPKKKMWYWHDEESGIRHFRQQSKDMDDIRQKYGSTVLRTKARLS